MEVLSQLSYAPLPYILIGIGQRAGNFNENLQKNKIRAKFIVADRQAQNMVGETGFEPVTPCV